VALFFTQLLAGIQNGAVYASLAIALVLIFRTTGVLNFAQGEMALFSTYLVWKFTSSGMPVWLAIILTMAISFVGGALIERIVLRPVEQAPPLVVVIVTIGMFLAINSLAQLAFGSGQKGLPSAYPQHTWRPGGVLISSDTLVLVAVLAVECALLYGLLQRTKLGLAFRGVASNPEATRLLGVPVGRILMVGWGLAAAVGALAGALVVPTTPGLVPSSMQEILVFAFAAAALGGFDSVMGAVVGGMIVGVADALTTGYVHALRGIDLVVPFGLILLVLLFRPAGLFGSTRVERV
jgi:branched-chain amino acid transport system permease protein